MAARRPLVLVALVTIALLMAAGGALGQTPSASPTATTPGADPMAGITSETLGSGVPAHLSVGTYEVVARYRTQQKAFPDVAIKKGERTVLDAAFE